MFEDGGMLEDGESMRTLQICPISGFTKFAGVSFKGINLVGQEYFVSQISWLETEQSKAIRLIVGGINLLCYRLLKGTVNQILFFQYFSLLC